MPQQELPFMVLPLWQEHDFYKYASHTFTKTNTPMRKQTASLSVR